LEADLLFVASTFIIIVFAGKIGDFVNNHPSTKILGLSFLLIISTLPKAKAFHYEIPKGYAYFAAVFSFLVELLNVKPDKKTMYPVKLKKLMEWKSYNNKHLIRIK